MKINDLVLRDGLLYTKERIMATDMFDMLKCRPIESLLSPLDIEYLHKIKLLACKLMKMLTEQEEYEEDEEDVSSRKGRSSKGRYSY